MSNITSLFPAERNLMNRERSSGMYRVLPYYVAKCLSDVELSYVVSRRSVSGQTMGASRVMGVRALLWRRCQ
eukprot:37641-Eustigmatos_ZCMA.PRE.1